MKRVSYVMAVLALFAVAGIAQAETDGVRQLQQKKEEVRKNIVEMKASTTQARKEFASTTAKRLNDAKKKAVVKLAERAMKNLKQRVENLENLAERIDSRIEKIEEQTGTTLTEQKAKLDAAEVKIQEADAAVTALEVKFKALASAENPRAALEGLKAETKMTEDAIREAHAALVDVVNSLKPGQQRKATTTAETATQ